EDTPRPMDGLELQFMRVCTTTDPNLQTRIVHAPATEMVSGDAWHASFTIPEASGEPRVWTMWAVYPSENESGPVQVIQGGFRLWSSPLIRTWPSCRRPECYDCRTARRLRALAGISSALQSSGRVPPQVDVGR